MWPDELPQQMEVGASLQPLTAFVRTPTSVGPSRSRRRFTAVPRFYSGTMLMNASQYAVFTNWYDNDIAGGSATFRFTDPDDFSSVVSARFVDAPSQALIVGGRGSVQLRRLSLSLELLP